MKFQWSTHLEKSQQLVQYSDDLALLDPAIVNEIERLDHYFGDLPPKEFNLRSVRKSEKWQRPRLMAGEILKKLGVELDRPALDWIFYVPG